MCNAEHLQFKNGQALLFASENKNLPENAENPRGSDRRNSRCDASASGSEPTQQNSVEKSCGVTSSSYPMTDPWDWSTGILLLYHKNQAFMQVHIAYTDPIGTCAYSLYMLILCILVCC